MNAASFFRNVDEMLHAAFVESIDDAVREFSSESIYAFILYPAGGFADFGLAVSSRERNARVPKPELDGELLDMLQNHPDLLAQANEHQTSPNYNLLTACEWDYFAEKRFARLNHFLDTNYDALYDLALASQQIAESFADSVTRIIQRAKSENCFIKPNIEPDPFLGFQYPDTDDRPLMLRVSAQVNSAEWHGLAVSEWGDS